MVLVLVFSAPSSPISLPNAAPKRAHTIVKKRRNARGDKGREKTRVLELLFVVVVVVVVVLVISRSLLAWVKCGG
jgi:t-SNARE complex subunit (syntaxin)